MAFRVPDDIDDITRIQHAPLRNLLITQRYHDLSKALSATLGGPDVNWSTFATWASKTAGESIRDEEVPRFVVELVDSSSDHDDGLTLFDAIRDLGLGFVLEKTHLLGAVRTTLRDVSGQIAEGNLKVFAELAPLFVEFARRFGPDSAPDASALPAFLGRLRPGPPDRDDGQELLARAFTAYHEARSATDDAARARHVLLGNALIGLHEQTRLQPQIRGALDAPVRDVVVAGVEAALREAIPDLVERRVMQVLERPLAGFAETTSQVWQRVATELLMSLALPNGERLALGRDLPRKPGEDLYPPVLRRIPGPNELVRLLAEYDRSEGEDTEAADWAELRDRMNFIVNLFRSRQRHPELLSPPFDDAVRVEIEARRMPGEAFGPL